MNSLLAFLETYEPTINAAVGLVTLLAASWGVVQLALLPLLRQASRESQAIDDAKPFRLWASLIDRGRNPHSDLIEQVAIRTLNACLIFVIMATLAWLVVTLFFEDILALSIISLFAFLLSVTAYNVQAAGHSNFARWLLITTVSTYWGFNIVLMGPRVGLEYFLGGLLILPLLLFGKDQKRELYLALLLIALVLPTAMIVRVLIDIDLPRSYSLIGPSYYYFNAIFLAVMVFLILYSYNRSADESFTELEGQMEQTDELIHSLLPAYIAEKVAAQEATVADWHSEATVLFATVHGFESLYKRVSAVQLVEILGEVFGEFDQVVHELGVERINTLGTNYLAATGIAPDLPAQNQALARAALRMREIIARLCRATGHSFSLTVGISTGELVSGVIGEDTLSFDIWGATVELANSMRGTAPSNTIVLNEAAFWRLRSHFTCEPNPGLDGQFLLIEEL